MVVGREGRTGRRELGREGSGQGEWEGQRGREDASGEEKRVGELRAGTSGGAESHVEGRVGGVGGGRGVCRDVPNVEGEGMVASEGGWGEAGR